MTTEPLTVECAFRWERRGRGGRKTLVERGAEPIAETGPLPRRVPRVTRWMALAIRCDRLLRDGVVATQSEIAQLGHVTRARMSQIMNLLNLAPDLQESLLDLPRIDSGREPLLLAQLQPIASTLCWRDQRRMWAKLRKNEEKRRGTP